MEKQQAIQLISDTFNDNFNEVRYTKFINNLLNDLEPKSNSYSGQMLWDDHKDHINSYKRIAKYTDPEGEALDVLIVEVKTIAKLERARTSLRNFVIKHLKKFEKDFALVAFYAQEDDGLDWRFSFIKLEHQSYFDEEKDKVKIKEELTPAKRYSFLVGKHEQSHTAKTQLLPLLQNLANNPTVTEIENAFSVEKVTDEFFSQYKDLYVKLYEHFDKEDHIKTELSKAKIDNARFTKKLLGQIVFLYFLQKKGWLGVPQDQKWGKGQRRFIQNLYHASQEEGSNFFQDKLQYLFYEALALERDNVDSYYNRFDCRIPFLNGGLFEAEYEWKTANITIPQTLFRSGEAKENDRTGILDVFDRYNFTIKEDEPLDKEVAVDPEMLGKVFENMLEITERKSKGAFYTPREIVHYMCQESLIHYLDNALEGTVKKKDIETYIRMGHNALENDQRVAKERKETATYKYILPKSIRNNADLIDQKLIDIKICDPAIGSGAFPVGLLHELVNAQLVIKPHFSDTYRNVKLKEFGFSKKDTPSESRYVYRLKRHIIQESIYGVDIDASAIDIARLRLWLSLVVDEDDFDPIETLPNLDYKIVCGNSLMSRFPLDMPIDNVFKEFNKKVQSDNYKNSAIKKLIGKKKINLESYKKLTNDYLKESSHEMKLLFRELISEIKSSFVTELENNDKQKLSDARGALTNLQAIDIFGKPLGTKSQISKAKKTFKELEKSREEIEAGTLYINAIEWRFEFPNLLNSHGDFKGFDVIIGNPPYKIEYDKQLKSAYENAYATFKRNNDIYVAFFQKGLQTLSDIGSLNFITPNTFLNGDYFIELRKHIVQDYKIIEVIDFKSHSVFKDPTVFVAITHISNSNKPIKQLYKIFEGKINISKYQEISESTKGLSFIPKHPVFNQINSSIDLKYEDVFLIKDVGFNYWSKGGRKNRKGDSIGKRVFLKERENKNDIPYLKGKQVHKFYNEKATNYLRHNYKEYLNEGIDVFRYSEEILQTAPKICYRQTSNKIIASLDFDSQLCDKTVHVIVNRPGNNYNLAIITALLNSELFLFLYRQISQESEGRAFSQVKTTYIKQLPFKYTEKGNLSILTKYIGILNQKNNESTESKFFTSVLDSACYELYFSEEIRRAKKEIIKHLEQLKPVENAISEEEKLAIIHSEFERLYHPEHPVRFAVETIDSIEEVRIIKEALK